MAAKLQGITLEINGDTKNLNEALKGTNKEISTTQSELKQVEKLLKLDPKNTELLAQKQQLLSKEVETTSKKLDSLKLAKKQADEQGLQGTESGQKAYRELQREIVETENKLKSFKEEQDKVSNKFDLLGEKASKINGVMGGLGLGVVAAGGALVKSGLDAAAYADDVNTIAAQTGLATDQIQKFQYASEIIDVPLETLTGSMAKLTKNMSTASKGTGDAANAFGDLGVEISDSNGELRSNQDVFNEVIGKLGEMENETQRDAYAMQIFGKSAQDLNPLIKGGADTLEELGQKAEEMGLILSQDALDGANQLNDGIDELKSQWNAATHAMGNDMAEYLMPVVEGLQELLKWVLDNKDTIVTVLGGIAAGIAAFNMVVMIQNMVKGFQAWQKATEGMSLAQAALNAIMNANPLAIVISLIVAIGAALVIAYNKSETFREGVNKVFNAVKETITGFVDTIVVFFTETIPNVFMAIVNFFKENWQEILVFLMNPFAGLIAFLYKLNPQFREWVDGIISNIKKWFGKISEVGRYIVEGLWQGIINAKDWLLNKIKEFASSITDGIKSFFGIESPSKVMRDQVGKYLAQGIGVGFEKEMGNVINDMTATAREITDAISTELDINTIPNINKSVTSQNFYTTKSYQNTTEIVRQPSNVTMQVDKTTFARLMIPALRKEETILGVNLQ